MDSVANLDLELLAFRLKLGGERIQKRAFLSMGSLESKNRMLPAARLLAGLGVVLYATEGTSKFLDQHNVPNTSVRKIAEGGEPNVLPLLQAGGFDLVVNVLTGDGDYDEKSDAKMIRRLAIQHGVPLITDPVVALERINYMVESLDRERQQVGKRISMRDYFAALVHARGGYVDNHGHYDKAYLITPDTLALGEQDMQKKWLLYRSLKENYTHDDLIERITRCIEFRISRGVTHMRFMVDADSIVQLKCIEAALEVKRRYSGKVALEIGIQPLEGVLEPSARKWVEKACVLADFVGGLPSKDHPRLEAHLDFVMSMAREMGKRLDVHVDQKGTPDEDETRLLALKTIEYGLEGRVAGVHSIISRKPLHEQREIAKMVADAGITIIVCPGAEISMKQLDMSAQMSNSLPPVPLYREHGAKVVYGSDNTEDPFMPFSDGDPWYEARLLMDGCRTYEGGPIADIMCDTSLFTQSTASSVAA